MRRENTRSRISPRRVYSDVPLSLFSGRWNWANTEFSRIHCAVYTRDEGFFSDSIAALAFRRVTLGNLRVRAIVQGELNCSRRCIAYIRLSLSLSLAPGGDFSGQSFYRISTRSLQLQPYSTDCRGFLIKWPKLAFRLLQLRDLISAVHRAALSLHALSVTSARSTPRARTW